MGKGIHVVQENGTWKAKREGCERSSGNFETQKKATDFARTIARNDKIELYIHRPNGEIRDRDSYGSDPCPPKDTKY